MTWLWAISVALGQTVGSDGNGTCWDYGTLFENAGAALGVRGFGNSLGVNLNDFDGDGRPDILVGMGPSRADGATYFPGESLLYIQQDDGTFVESGAQFGLDDLCEDRSPIRADLDGDGLPDVYMTVNGRNILFHNDAWAWYADVTAWAGAAAHPGWGHQGFALDYDRDGWLDLFFTNGPEDGSAPNTLLRNQRDGTFRDVSDVTNVAATPSGKGTCVLDVNGDMWPDIFVTTGREFGNHLFINQTDGTFRDEALERGIADPLRRFGVGATCADLDNDGDPDILLVTHDIMYTGNQLFENRDGVFVDVAAQASDETSEPTLQERIDPHGTGLVDLDNDGLLDVVLSGFGFQPHVYMNQGGMVFKRACRGAGIQAEDLLSWGVVGSDLTGDGYSEVYISSGLGRRPADDALFRYIGPTTNRWLGVDVRGLTHNRSALGAKVEFTTPSGTVTRWVGAWSSFDSQGRDTVIAGLGSHDAADVRVTFTNGAVVELEDVAALQTITVEEPIAWSDADHDGVPDSWDACPGTPLGRTKDGDGCAVGQRGGLAVTPVEPRSFGVVTDCFSFTWAGDTDASAVVQVSGDGTFGVSKRVDIGPVTGGSVEVCGALYDEILAMSDGSNALVWRVALADDQGREALSLPAAFYMALPVTDVRTPRGANVFEPAHIIVPQGTTVTWWNDSVNAGNIQSEPHDVQLMDATGGTIDRMLGFEASGSYAWTFNQPGLWHYICHQHSGVATNTDASHESSTLHHHRTDGPYRCMAGTVTVR